MNRRMIVGMALFLIGVSIAVAATVDEFGEGLSEGVELAAIEAILADPDAWVGKTVQIAGRVSGVCSRQGCWIDLTSDTDATLRVKVDDGVIVFPPESVGRRGIAEGTVEILELERERYEAWMHHVAEEEDREFDPASIGEGPYRVVRLRGLGAEITGP